MDHGFLSLDSIARACSKVVQIGRISARGSKPLFNKPCV
jgi:hypothetical protein